MKRRQILARAITLSLLLAMPCSAWAETIDNSVWLNNNTDYTTGLLVETNGALYGTSDNFNLSVTGQVSEGTASYNVINKGIITDIGVLTADSLLNQGSLNAVTLNVAKGEDNVGMAGGFRVTNLNVTASDTSAGAEQNSFTLNGAAYGFTTLNVGANSKLTSTYKDEVNDAGASITIGESLVLGDGASLTASDRTSVGVWSGNMTIGPNAALAANRVTTDAGNIILQDGASITTSGPSDVILATGSLTAGENSRIDTSNITIFSQPGNEASGSMTTAAGSVITADALDIADALNVGGTLNAKDGTIKAASLTTEAGSAITAGTVNLTVTNEQGGVQYGAMIVGGTANIGSTITAGSLKVLDGGSITGVTDADGTLAKPEINISGGGITLDNNASVIAGSINTSGGDLSLGTGSSIKADGINLKIGNVSNGAVTLGKDASITVGELAADYGELVGASLTTEAGSSITAGKKIELAGALELGGILKTGTLTADTITSSAGSEIIAKSITADKTGGLSSIGGTATVTDVIANGYLTVSGTLAASNEINVSNKLTVNGGSVTSDGHVLADVLTVNSGNVTAAYINKQNNGIMSEVYLGSGAVVTVQNDDNNGDIKTYALTTAAGSQLTSDYLNLGSADISGAATVKATLNASGNVRLGAAGSLTAANATINGILSTADAAAEEAGAKITTTYALKAGMLLVGAKGAVTADSVTTDDGISLGSGASAEVAKGISTKGAFTIADEGSVTAGSITAGELKVSGGSMTVTEGINTSGALTVTDNSSVTAGSVAAGGLRVNGSSMAVTAGINTSRDFIVNDKGSVTAGSVTAGGLSVNGGSSMTAANIKVGITDDTAQGGGSLTAGTDSVINADTIDVSGGLMSVGGTVNAGSSITAKVLEVLAGGSVTGVQDETNSNALNISAAYGMDVAEGASVAAQNVEAGILNNNGELSAGTLTVATGEDNGTLKVDNLIVSESSSESRAVNSFELNSDKYSFESVNVGEGAVLTTAAATSISTDTLTNDGTIDASSLEANTLANSSKLNAEKVEAGTLNNSGELSAGTLTVANGADNGTLKVDNLIISESSNESETANSFALNKTDYSFNSVSVGEGSALKAAGAVAVSDTLTIAESASAEAASSISAGSITTGANSSVTAGFSIIADSFTTGTASSVEAESIAAANLLANESSRITAAFIAADAFTAAKDSVIAVDYIVSEDKLEVGAGAQIMAKAEDSAIYAGALTAEADSAITISSIYVENALENAGTLTAKSLFVTSGSDNGTLNVEQLTVNESSEGNTNSFALNNDKYSFSLVSVEKGSSLEAAGSDVSVNTIGLAAGSSFTADGVQQVQTIHLENNASLTGGTVTMADDGVINSNGGSLTAEELNGNGLTINLQTDKKGQVKVESLTGDTLTVTVNALNDEGSISDNQVEIGSYDGNVKIVGSSDITDSFGEDLQGGMKDLADSLNISNSSGSVVIKSEEGDVVGEITGTVDKNGNVVIDEDINYDNLGISEMASIGLMTWRQENNDMNKRLGELRDSSGEHGVWVRMTRGESKYGAQNIKNQYNSYQLGYDEKLSVDKHWTVGAALTYTDANSSFGNGKGENKHKGLSVYGSRLNDDGSFIDLIARYARLEHDFEVHGGAGKGAYDTNGYSLSAEYGKRFTQASGLWLEPQVELTYGRVSGADYISDKGVRVRQDGMDSFVGRLGFALGQNLAKGKGNVYLRASYLYDFEGETDVRFSSATQSRGFKQDLGGGWWEVGVGANINISEATHLYFDVEKTYGGNVATPWQWNAGLRWSF